MPISKKKQFVHRGFSLLEIVIAMTLLAFSAVTLMHLFYSGKYFLIKSDNLALANSVAYFKMEEYLSRAYSALIDGTLDTGKERNIDWTVRITAKQEINVPALITIPYKVIEVTASYEETWAAAPAVKRTVRLESIFPYPLIHTDSVYKDGTLGIPILVPFSVTPPPPPPVPPSPYQPIGLFGFDIKVDYAVKKNIMVIYNISLDLVDATGIDPADTIYTGVFLDGVAIPAPIMTRTPILTQPLISNSLILPNVPSGAHTIEIKWYKDVNSGIITLRGAELVIIATEAP